MKKLLIRAEDKNRWERRTPLVPADFGRILKDTGTSGFVQESDKRYFGAEAYSEVGAEICQDMTPGNVIFGVKEIPVEKILDNKVYLFFSHTIKGQKYNMPLLQRILDSGSTLIDYERITTESNRRIVYFGRYAGDAGAIDILSLMGEYWSTRGITTPLSEIKRAHEYNSVADAKDHLIKVGKVIEKRGFPTELVPFTVAVLGYGNVSEGAQQILDCLPTCRVDPDAMETLVKEGHSEANIVYVSVFKEQHLVGKKDGSSFDLMEYFEQPGLYQSLYSKYLPFYTLLINAVYWDERYPRFVTWKNLKELAKKGPLKLSGIADITCDTYGSIECNIKSTDTGNPAYQVDPLSRKVLDGHTGDGIVVLAVDNLPCELPNDASTFFSGQLSPLVPNILGADYESTLESSGLDPEVSKAVIVYRGELTSNYRYLERNLNS